MFDVGDKVIVTEGVIDCEKGCSDAMEDMIGSILTISEVQEDQYPTIYKTVEDNGRWAWTDRCFVLECPNETPVSDDEFDGIMSFLCQDSTPPPRHLRMTRNKSKEEFVCSRLSIVSERAA